MLSHEQFQAQFTEHNAAGISQKLYIRKSTGECYLQFRGAARLIDKHHEYVRRHVKQGLRTGTLVDLLEVEISTSQGLRTGTLLGEDALLEVISKYKPELLVAFAKLGLRSWLYEQAGYAKQETPTKDITDKIDNLLKLRTLAKDYHSMFQHCCYRYGLPARKVHDELTKLINGNTADDNRLIQELIGKDFDDESIGINHVLDERFHYILAMSKKHFSNSRHQSDWKNELVRAYQRSVKEWSKLSAE